MSGMQGFLFGVNQMCFLVNLTLLVLDDDPPRERVGPAVAVVLAVAMMLLMVA